MLVNTSKTVIMNACLSSRSGYSDEIIFDDNFWELKLLKFVVSRNTLINIVAKCNSRLS